jgi:hypothetical protein
MLEQLILLGSPRRPQMPEALAKSTAKRKPTKTKGYNQHDVSVGIIGILLLVVFGVIVVLLFNSLRRPPNEDLD